MFERSIIIDRKVGRRFAAAPWLNEAAARRGRGNSKRLRMEVSGL
jgi:hypothetical protein